MANITGEVSKFQIQLPLEFHVSIAIGTSGIHTCTLQTYEATGERMVKNREDKYIQRSYLGDRYRLVCYGSSALARQTKRHALFIFPTRSPHFLH